MAGGHGGYRRPSDPAPVSGPGRLSRRTDGQPIMDAPGGEYGDRQALHELQQAAPLASAPAPAGSTGPGIDLSGVVPLSAPSAQPDVPVTSGANAGAGPGMDALGLPDKSADAQFLAKWLPAYIARASRDDAPPGLVAHVKKIIAQT